MNDLNTNYDYPTQVNFSYLYEHKEHKGIAYQDIVIDIATGEVLYIGDDINIIHVHSSWSPYFMD